MSSSNEAGVKRKPDGSSHADSEDRRHAIKKKRTAAIRNDAAKKTSLKTPEVAPTPRNKKTSKDKAATAATSITVGRKTTQLAGKSTSRRPVEHSPSRSVNDTTSEGESDSGNAETDPFRLLHESLSSSNKKGRPAGGTKTKYSPPDETQEQRDARTVFIGNLPLEIAGKKVRAVSRHKIPG